MNLIQFQNKYSKTVYLFVALTTLLVQACSKTSSEAVVSGAALVNINLSVGEADEEIITVGNTKRQAITAPAPKVQLATVPVDKGISMDVMVIREDQASNSTLVKASNAVNKAAAVETKKVLDPNVRYRLAIYDSKGVHKGNFDYSYGKEASTAPLALDGGQTYTFIAYSVNSTTALPTISGQSNLATASLNDISGDLMFFKKTLKLNVGSNLLSVVLKHQFSQITTTVKLDNSMTGFIESLSGVQVTPTKATASLKFADESLSYPTASLDGKITFPSLPAGARSVNSERSIFISPTTTSANLKIGSIRLDGTTKTNLSIPNVKFIPGHRYTLVLNFKVCTQDVTSDAMNWNYKATAFIKDGATYNGIFKNDENKYYKNNEVISNTFTAPQANYGFLFDITQFDNAFNMEVNNTYIFGKSAEDQVQFQTNPGLGTVRNVQFIDGTEYTLNGIPEVFALRGTPATPILRILISRNGEVTLYGSKSNNGPLVELRLKNNAKFNTVKWNSTGNNSIKVTQKVDGETVIIGVGKGRKWISCPN